MRPIDEPIEPPSSRRAARTIRHTVRRVGREQGQALWRQAASEANGGHGLASSSRRFSTYSAQDRRTSMSRSRPGELLRHWLSGAEVPARLARSRGSRNRARLEPIPLLGIMTLAVTKGASSDVQTEPVLETGPSSASGEATIGWRGRPYPGGRLQVEPSEKSRVFSGARDGGSEVAGQVVRALDE